MGAIFRMKRRSHKLLMTSLGISVLVHLVGIWGFYKNPLVFSPSHLFSPKHKSVESLASNKEAEKEEKGVALEEALNQMIRLHPQLQSPFDLESIAQKAHLLPEEEKSSFEVHSPFHKL